MRCPISEAKLDFTSDATVGQREIDKMVKATAKLREQIRTMNQESKKGSQESASTFNSMAGALAKVEAEEDGGDPDRDLHMNRAT